MIRAATAVELLIEWGFGQVSSDQLLAHAENVMKWHGQRVGIIVAGLGLADESAIERILSVQPKGTKTLEYLKEAGIRNLSSRIDEIMAIQMSVPYVSNGFRDLIIHPYFGKKDVFAKHRAELTKWDVLPMSCEGSLILMFGDFEKMTQFKAQAGSERMNSGLAKSLASVMDISVESGKFSRVKTAIAAGQVLLDYQQRVSELGASVVEGDETLQTIRSSEAGDEELSRLVKLLGAALERGANDIAIVPDRDTGKGKVYYRKYQKLIDSGVVLSADERIKLTMILTARSRANPGGGRLRKPADGNLNFEGRHGQAFLRLSFIPLEESQFPSTSTSIRLLPRTAEAVNLSSLNIDPDLQEELRFFLRRKHGLFVVCGPTGSGKSTTIAAMLTEHLDHYGQSSKRISVEQPCERIIPGVLHIDVSQHRYNEGERDSDTDNFSMALRAILRHDPDVIFVGEIRDKESCTVSVDAANTGHLVFSTTHANSPVLGYRRMASLLDEDRRFDLVNVIEGILAQRLVSTICTKCSSVVEMDEKATKLLKHYASRQGIDLSGYEMPSTHRVVNTDGCDDCLEGNDGMLPVHGLLAMNPKVRELLLSHDEKDWMKAQAASESKFSLFRSAFKLFEQGRIDLDSVMI